MADQKLIKERIKATEKTYQITNAMNMVSTSKLRKSEKSLKQFRPISDEIKKMMISLVSNSNELSHPTLIDNGAKPCYILIASDRGLIGNYNNALFKYFDGYIKEHHKSNDEFYVATIGFKAFSYAKRKRYNLINEENINIRDDILFIDFSEVSDLIRKGYIEGRIGKTTVFYTSFVNTITNKIIEETILPISVLKDDSTDHQEYIYEPGIEMVLDRVIDLYVDYSLYRIILEAKTSEHASRMNAMKNAKDNAKDIEEKLTLEYNHARQNQITTELIDIINGSNAIN